MADRIGENGALQYAAANFATASSAPRIGMAGFLQGAYVEYLVWKTANSGVNPNRISARGRIYGKFFDSGL